MRHLLVFIYLVCIIYLQYTYGLPSSSVIIEPLPRDPCPSILGCQCEDDNPSRLWCRKITFKTIGEISMLYPFISFLSISEWEDKEVALDHFANFTNLVTLEIVNGQIEKVVKAQKQSKTLKHISLASNKLMSFSALCNLSAFSNSLYLLDGSGNQLIELEDCKEISRVKKLDLSKNKIAVVSGYLPVQYLNLSHNEIREVDNLSSDLIGLDLSANPLTLLKMGSMKKLLSLSLDDTHFDTLPTLQAPSLREIRLRRTRITYADFSKWRTPKMENISMENSTKLELVNGELPSSVVSFSLSQSKIYHLPAEFFKSVSLKSLDLSDNDWDCDACMYRWSQNVQDFMTHSICTPSNATQQECLIGCSLTQPEIIKSRFGQPAILPCTCYGYPTPTVEWVLYRPKHSLGTFDPVSKQFTYSNGSKIGDRYQMMANGIRFPSPTRDHIERYVCIVRNEHGQAYRIVKFRLDYSYWYSLNLFESVFWGSCLTSLVVCALSFLLNITWILSRKSILWWIHRAERLSRVRKMVEAMEKYRARQMEGLHEKYARKVQNVRDNYHQQVEQLRSSYASQAERFRDYKAARIENVASHLEHIRDNYNQQMQRVREYGSRRSDQLWESYERQCNRMRAFSLQHRLKLMRQYKVKQRYLNKLLESFQDTHSPEAMRKHEEEVRAALESLKEPPEGVGESGLPPLSRASSFYSLPEYTLDVNGQLRPSPLVPNVRFEPIENFREKNRASTSGTQSQQVTPNRFSERQNLSEGEKSPTLSDSKTPPNSD